MKIRDFQDAKKALAFLCIMFRDTKTNANEKKQ